jgi:hypothetical protein
MSKVVGIKSNPSSLTATLGKNCRGLVTPPCLIFGTNRSKQNIESQAPECRSFSVTDGKISFGQIEWQQGMRINQQLLVFAWNLRSISTPFERHSLALNAIERGRAWHWRLLPAGDQRFIHPRIRSRFCSTTLQIRSGAKIKLSFDLHAEESGRTRNRQSVGGDGVGHIVVNPRDRIRGLECATGPR